MKNFALIGSAGFVAKRHFAAIKETKNNLIVSIDPSDNVGILDNYFPNSNFFTDFERFDRYLNKLKTQNIFIDYFSVCSPNFLHDFHIRYALKNNSNVICEKPIVLNPWNIEPLIEIQNKTNKNIYSILQLRLHPKIIELKNKIQNSQKNQIFDVDLTYITSRGNWYYTSWKGNIEKSGGIATNIGIHFFDMLTWIFGDIKQNKIHIHTHDRASGFLELKNARIRWFLSINENTIPYELRKQGKKIFRSMKINNEEFDFSEGFTDLHTKSYQEIINGNGFKIEETHKSIEIVHEIRTKKTIGLKGDFHPFAKLKQDKHPFL